MSAIDQFLNMRIELRHSITSQQLNDCVINDYRKLKAIPEALPIQNRNEDERRRL